MTVISYKSDEAEEPVNSTSWVDVESVAIDLEDAVDSGEYIFWVNCEYAGLNVDEIVGVRVLLDGVEVAFDHFKPVLSDQFRSFSPMGLKNLSIGLHSLVLQARCLDATQTVKVKRKRLLVMKH